MNKAALLAARSILLLGMPPLAGCAADPVTPDAGSVPPNAPVMPIGGRKLTYPADMARMGKQGDVSVDCTITRDGSTRDCVITHATNRDFAQAARDYVDGARYRPAMKNGMPVEVAHHTFTIRFRFPTNATRLAYDCSIAATGKVRDCRDETPPGTIPPALGAVVLERLEALSMGLREKAVGDPYRRIDVLLTVQADPDRDAWIPALPVQVQVNLLLDCNARSVPQCREIAGPPPSKDMQHGGDEITGIAMGFNGIMPTQAATAD